MTFNKFNIKLIVRQLLIMATMCLIIIHWHKENKLFTLIVLVILLFTIVIELIYFLNRSNRRIQQVADHIRNTDYSLKTNAEHKAGRGLEDSMEDIIRDFLDVRMEKEAHLQILQIIIDEINAGVLLIDKTNKFRLANKFAKEKLNLRSQVLKAISVNNRNIMQIIESWPNRNPELVLYNDDRKYQYSYTIKPLRIRDQNFQLVLFFNIEREISKKEVDSWQSLSRTLSHEMMNSLTPIISLSDTALMQIRKLTGGKNHVELDKKRISKTTVAIQTIHKRSSNLLNFIDNFRKLYHLPQPQKKTLNTSALIKGVIQLMETELETNKIHVTLTSEPQKIFIKADEKLMEQVLINLFLNAIQAQKNIQEPIIDIRIKQQKNNICIAITDNGEGIDSAQQDKLFVPFYSTKENGSGIGLSLCKQILLAHGGEIHLSQAKVRGTVVHLYLPT